MLIDAFAGPGLLAGDTESPARPKPLKLGTAAPDFALKDQTGKEWRLSAQKGKRIVLLSFGITSCVCGQAALRDLQSIQEKYGERGVQVVHVNTEFWMTDFDPEYLAKFAKENKITYPMLVDKGLVVSSLYPCDAMPFLYMVNRKGAVCFTLAGHPDDYLKRVTKAVEKELLPQSKSKPKDERSSEKSERDK